MTLENLIDFLKNDIRGLIILAVVTSILAAIFYDGLKKAYVIFIRYRKQSETKKTILAQIKNYTEGYTAGYAKISTYHETVLTGHYIVRIMLQAFAIIFSTILFVASLLLIGQPFSWIITVIFSAILTLQYRRLNELRKFYLVFMDTIFGDEFKEEVKKKSLEHIKSKIKEDL